MTPPDPAKMRQLADELPMPEDWERPFLNGAKSLNEKIAAVLRDAADVIESVKVYLDTDPNGHIEYDDAGRTAGDIERIVGAKGSGDE